MSETTAEVGQVPTSAPPAYAELVDAFRDMQSALAASAPPPDIAAALSAEFRSATERLTAFGADEKQRLARRPGPSGGGRHPSLIPYRVDESDDRRLTATVTFTQAHLGGNGAVHGGMIPLLFDDVLGIFVSTAAQPGSRTAFLKVNYRKITPVGRPLRVTASIDAIEGRKTWITGSLLDGDETLADAEALFLRLLPGQP
ncbi:PaaI family thioesterase [Nocardia sp. NBC_00565]|uniref:PaaI family thioesterase n=1 Tax=Nocardia sp. NBC_00565 TaxID=2975993 RepID=UPI002E81E6BA|nr:PaaI family thioesterase [Nocardia sp. NBC_00565]WUC06782.1 PaaI family thioesterase [Nocardia sp. NBC_00565]